MAGNIEPWIEETVSAEIAAAKALQTEIKQDAKSSILSDDGGVLRTEVTPDHYGRDFCVQLVKFIHAKPPVTAFVSDGRLRIKARLSNQAAKAFSEAIGDELDESLKGDILMLKRFTIRSTPWGPADWRIELDILQVTYLTTQRKIIGAPTSLSGAADLLRLVASLHGSQNNVDNAVAKTPSVLSDDHGAGEIRNLTIQTAATPEKQVRVKVEPGNDAGEATTTTDNITQSSPVPTSFQTQMNVDLQSSASASATKPANTRKEKVPSLDRDGLQIDTASNLEDPRTANYTRPSSKPTGSELLSIMARGHQNSTRETVRDDHSATNGSKQPAKVTEERTSHPNDQQHVKKSPHQTRPETQTESSSAQKCAASTEINSPVQSEKRVEHETPRNNQKSDSTSLKETKQQLNPNQIWEQRQNSFKPTRFDIPPDQQELLYRRSSSLHQERDASSLQECVPLALLNMWTKSRLDNRQDMPSTSMRISSPDRQPKSKSTHRASAHDAQLQKNGDIEMASGSDSDSGSEDDDDEEPLPGWHSTPSQAVPPSSGVVTMSQSPSRRDIPPNNSGDLEMSVPQTIEQSSNYRNARTSYLQGEQRKEWLRTNYAVDGHCKDFSATEAAAAYVKKYPGDVVSATKMEEIWSEMNGSQPSSKSMPSTKISATPIVSSSDSKSTLGQSKKEVDSTDRVPDSSEKPRAAIRLASSSDVAMQASQKRDVAAQKPVILVDSEQGSRAVIAHHIDDVEMSDAAEQNDSKDEEVKAIELPLVEPPRKSLVDASGEMHLSTGQEAISYEKLSIAEIDMPKEIELKPANEQNEQDSSPFEDLAKHYLTVKPGGADFLSDFSGSNQRMQPRQTQSSKARHVDVLSWSLGSKPS